MTIICNLFLPLFLAKIFGWKVESTYLKKQKVTAWGS